MLREGKNIFLARQFSARPRLLARRGHGFHTRPGFSTQKDLAVGTNVSEVVLWMVGVIRGVSTDRFFCTRVNVGTFGHSRVKLFLSTCHVVQCNVSNDI